MEYNGKYEGKYTIPSTSKANIKRWKAFTCSVQLKMLLYVAVICALYFSPINSAQCSRSLNTIMCVNVTADVIRRLPNNYQNETSLVLQNSKLHKLSARIFADLRFVTTVTLSNCAIKEIDDHAFDGLTLKYLNLQNNSMKTISNDLFKNLMHLKFLDLSYNNISHIGEKALENLKELILFDLSYNSLSHVPIIGSLIKLETLNLCNNKLTNIEVDRILDLKHIKEFFFEDNLYPHEYEESLREKFSSTGIIVDQRKSYNMSKNVNGKNSNQLSFNNTKNSSSVVDDVEEMLELSPECIMSLNSSELEDYTRRITQVQKFLAREKRMLDLDRARVQNETESARKELNRVEQIKKRIQEIVAEARTESADKYIQKTCDTIPADSWFKRFKRWKCRNLLKWGNRIAVKNQIQED